MGAPLHCYARMGGSGFQEKWGMAEPCPKRVGSFGSSTRFLMRNEQESDIDSVRKL